MNAELVILPKPLKGAMTLSDTAESHAPMPDSVLPPKKACDFRKALGIKTSLVGAVVVTITLTAAIVYIPWAISSRRNLKTMVAKNNEEIVLGASHEVKRLLGSARAANSLIQKSFSNSLIDFEDAQAGESFFLNLLESNPDFTWIQLGFENGDFLGVQRLYDGNLRTHFRDWDEETQTTQKNVKTYVTSAPDSKIFERSESMEPAFYAPDRPWYKAAVESLGEQVWSVYIYRSTLRPGLDATVSISRNDDLFGVVGVGIGLEQLSQFLRKELSIQSGGEIFIIYANREILASTDVTEIHQKSFDGDNVELKLLSEADNPLLRQVDDALSHPESNEVLLSDSFLHTDNKTGQGYYISLSDLGYLDWMVGTVVPTDVYLGKIQRGRQILLVVNIFFILVTAGLAVFLSDRMIAKPILTVAQAASDIESETFEVQGLTELAIRNDEFGQLARVFQKMARQVAARQQQLKKQVTALTIEIDDVKQQQQVKKIVETDFFQDLTAKAKTLRQRNTDRKQ